jgi:hypothetical protein
MGAKFPPSRGAPEQIPRESNKKGFQMKKKDLEGLEMKIPCDWIEGETYDVELTGPQIDLVHELIAKAKKKDQPLEKELLKSLEAAIELLENEYPKDQLEERGILKLKAVLSKAESKPSVSEEIPVLIFLDGGRVQKVVSTGYPVEVIVIDEDTDGIPDDELTHFKAVKNNGIAFDFDGLVDHPIINTNPKLVAEYKKQIDQ